MKRPLLLLAALLLTASLAWAGESAPNDDLFADAGGGCMLPDLAGLSPDEAAAAALESGLQVSPSDRQVPLCPVAFQCNSLFNCGIGQVCAIGILGPCCTSGGFQLCCISGNIRVKACPCRCTGSPCNIQCPSSTNVTWGCV